MKASYEVYMLISKAGKPHIIAEELVLPAAKAREKSAKVLNFVALSNEMLNKRIDKVSGTVKEQLIEIICKVRIIAYK